MKAAVLVDKGQIVCRDVEKPQPGPGEVLLRVRVASICGSDISKFIDGHRLYPLIPGHEVAGEVTALGKGVDSTWQGRRAIMIPLIPCMTCTYCKHGLFSACGTYSYMGSRRAGGFAEYVTIPAVNLLPLPDDVDDEAGALIEPATVARHVLERGRFTAGQTVAVFGAGSVGLMAVQWLRKLGAARIMVSDLADENLAYARNFGADLIINASREDPLQRILMETGGVDLALELAGVPETLSQAIHATRPRGAVMLAGNQPIKATFPAGIMETITRKELGVYGTWMSYSAPFPGHEWHQALEAMRTGELHTAEMISHRFPLSEVAEVFQKIAQHTLTHRKILLYP